MKNLYNKMFLAGAAATASLAAASPAFALVTPGENGDQSEVSTTGNDYQGIVDNIDVTEVAGITVLVGSAIAIAKVARMGVRQGLGTIR
ncbi:hypothetical protein [Sphingomonas sp. RB1R13]|uniref:hypothetical protein n=1 Tax=Sphingomonas sp. RB1R13 TaxID=3096159 RepID=UPI002FCC794D